MGVIGHRCAGGGNVGNTVPVCQLLQGAVQGAEMIDKGVDEGRHQGNGIIVTQQDDLCVGVQCLQLLHRGLDVCQRGSAALAAELCNAGIQQPEGGFPLLSGQIQRLQAIPQGVERIRIDLPEIAF